VGSACNDQRSCPCRELTYTPFYNDNENARNLRFRQPNHSSRTDKKCRTLHVHQHASVCGLPERLYPGGRRTSLHAENCYWLLRLPLHLLAVHAVGLGLEGLWVGLALQQVHQLHGNSEDSQMQNLRRCTCLTANVHVSARIRSSTFVNASAADFKNGAAAPG